jgi:3-phosphoshikimate 1-carboxyvinyltransferase
VRVQGLTRASRQGDARFVDVLAAMGCVVTEGPDWLEVAAPADGRLRGVSVDLNAMPDTAQTLAVTALCAAGPTEIRNVANLRIKETDRLAALATELTRLGADVDVRPDGLTIHPPERLRPAAIETYDDHRMAMSFALAGLVVDGVVIREANCVSKSFPAFFHVLNGM